MRSEQQKLFIAIRGDGYRAARQDINRIIFNHKLTPQERLLLVLLWSNGPFNTESLAFIMGMSVRNIRRIKGDLRKKGFDPDQGGLEAYDNVEDMELVKMLRENFL